MSWRRPASRGGVLLTLPRESSPTERTLGEDCYLGGQHTFSDRSLREAKCEDCGVCLRCAEGDHDCKDGCACCAPREVVDRLLTMKGSRFLRPAPPLVLRDVCPNGTRGCQTWAECRPCIAARGRLADVL